PVHGYEEIDNGEYTDEYCRHQNPMADEIIGRSDHDPCHPRNINAHRFEYLGYAWYDEGEHEKDDAGENHPYKCWVDHRNANTLYERKLLLEVFHDILQRNFERPACLGRAHNVERYGVERPREAFHAFGERLAIVDRLPQLFQHAFELAIRV